MGLFDFIKSIFGMDETTRQRTGETNVAVEREPNNEGDEVGEPVAESTDAAGSTESILDEDEAVSEPTEAAEPAEAADSEPEEMTTDVERTGLESESNAPVDESTSDRTGEREPTSEEIDEGEPGSEEIDEGEPGSEEIDEGEPGSEEIDEGDEVGEPVAESTDAADSTESILDEDEAVSEPTEAAEPAEAADSEPEEMTTDVERTGLESESDAPTGGEPTVQEIKGIGPAYGERLVEAGVATVADLADADAEDLSDRTAVSESRVEEWIDRARGFEE